MIVWIDRHRLVHCEFCPASTTKIGVGCVKFSAVLASIHIALIIQRVNTHNSRELFVYRQTQVACKLIATVFIAASSKNRLSYLGSCLAHFTLMKNLLVVGLIALSFSFVSFAQSDADLRATIEKDRTSRASDGKLMTLSIGDHISRGFTYLDNRQFPQAREHFQKVIDVYPNDPLIQRALFGMGRALMWEREYARAIPYFDRVSREFSASKDGREGLAFKGACHIRLGKNAEAAKSYEQYTVMYPSGERIDSAYLNIIDALREAGRDAEAVSWVDKARQRFPGQPTEANALQARLRLEINRGRWADAEATADTMLSQVKFNGSMTSTDEVLYLKGFAMEHGGKRNEAIAVYSSILDRPEIGTSYFGDLAKSKKLSIGEFSTSRKEWNKYHQDYPAAFRTDVLLEAKKRKLDPRFVMAIMKQESTFRPGVKSPSAARGLLQLVFDTALKYNKKAGYPALQPDDLYVPRTNIAIGCEYIAALRDQFGGLNEAIAASYNGGEDNAARWLNRSKPKEAGIFAAEIGFAETKNYVLKVMTSYRIYRDLYDENLVRR